MVQFALRFACGRQSDRHRNKKMPTVSCHRCGKQIDRRISVIKKSAHSFCSYRCNARWRVEHSSGKNHFNYKGRGARPNGYIWTNLFEYTEEQRKILKPMRTTTNRHIPEHRAVVALCLNRALESKEVVHHLNGVKTDNRRENLYLTTNGQHGRIHRAERATLVVALRKRIRELESELAKRTTPE